MLHWALLSCEERLSDHVGAQVHSQEDVWTEDAPGCSQAIFLLEDWVRYDELVLSAELKQESPIVVTVTKAVPMTDSFPGH